MAGRKQTFTPEFRAEAVRLAQTGGRSRREIAAGLSVGLSTLRNWIDGRRERKMDRPPAERQKDMAAELKRLRRKNEVLRQEREILKRATAFFRQGGKAMRFPFIDAAKKDFPVARLARSSTQIKGQPAARRPRIALLGRAGSDLLFRDLRAGLHFIMDD